MYDAWKKKVMPDTTRIYYIDTWVLSQNLPYYRPETLTSFIKRNLQAGGFCKWVKSASGCKKKWVKTTHLKKEVG